MQIPMRVREIPAIIEVDSHVYVPHARCSPYLCDSSDDYYGYEEVDWHVLDRRGRPADWLERKLSKADRNEIESELLTHFEKQRREYDD